MENFYLKGYLNDLEYLVNIDSGSNNISGLNTVADFFMERFKDGGWNVDIERFNDEVGPCLVIKNKDKVETDVLLIGHMDTVFPNGTTKERPFTIVDNKAFGPGVIDMKSGLLSILYALNEIKNQRLDKDISIKAIINSDEEIGSKYSTKIIEKYAKNSKLALILEPARANGAIVLERKGIAAFNISFEGIAAHAGIEPEKGASAIVELGHWIVELNKLNNYEIGTTVNVGIVKGGTGRNVIPNKSQAQIDLRFKDIKEAELFERQVQNLKKTPFVKGVSVAVDKLGIRPPMNLTSDTRKIWEIIQSIGQKLDINLTWVSTGGGSDANTTSALGVPSIDGLGPVGGGAHGINEYIEIDSIIPRYELLKRIIINKKIHDLLDGL